MSTMEPRKELVTLTVDGKEVCVAKGTLIIRAAENLGIEVPRFCDHPFLDPIGACRQCYVEIEGQRKLFTGAARLAVNIAMYVLCSNYKDDQVHAEHIMKRRRMRDVP